MEDPRIAQLAQNLVGYSCAVKQGENVLIESVCEGIPLVQALIREIQARGARPYVWLRSTQVDRLLIRGATEEQLGLMAKADCGLMAEMQAFIGIRGGLNSAELSDTGPEQQAKYARLYSKPLHGDLRVPQTKWCSMRYPTPSVAQMADMSTEAFEDYYFRVCNLDYARLAEAMEPLRLLMERTDKVQILGPGTSLEFSIKGMPAIKCAGDHNLPDGEVFSAPVQGSVNGVITYNIPSLYEGFTFENIRLTYQDGRLVDAQCNDTARIQGIFDRDEGAKSVGEFSFGVNPHITKPMKDILFDEKMTGSFHFTPGKCYADCDNGNYSSIHWDLICAQTPAYGGGEIRFDGVPVRRDGLFVLPELEALNPENLI